MATTVRYTVINGEIITELRGGRRLYVPDALGSTRALITNTQHVADTFSYWPYGEVNAMTGFTAPPFQFVGTRGYYLDSQVGTGTKTYVRARYLDVAKGRWLTKDPIGIQSSEVNLYQYENDNPIKNVVAPIKEFKISSLERGPLLRQQGQNKRRIDPMARAMKPSSFPLQNCDEPGAPICPNCGFCLLELGYINWSGCYLCQLKRKGFLFCIYDCGNLECKCGACPGIYELEVPWFVNFGCPLLHACITG